MDRFRRPLLFIAGLLLVAFGGELAARAVASTTPEAIRWYDAFTQAKVEQMDDRDRVDVVFAGTSMAWQAFVPATFDAVAGTESFNAGLNGGTSEVMERWLPGEVLPRLSPTTVIWGLSSYDFAPNYGAAQRELYDDALATREGALAWAEQSVATWSTLMRERIVLRSFDDVGGAGADRREAVHDRADAVVGPGGERLEFTVDVSDDRRAVTQARLRDFAIDPTDRERIVRTIEAMQAQGVQVVLAQLPVPQRFIDAHPRSFDHALVGPAIDELATELDLRFLDLSDGFTDGDFVDFTHLDQAATIEFSELAAEAFLSGADDRGTTEAPELIDDPEPTDPTNCVARTVIDEYGFEVEVVDCDAVPDTTNPDPAPTVETGQATAMLENAVTARDDACATGEDPVPALLGIAAALDTAVDAFRANDASPEQIRFAHDVYANAVLSGGGCATPNHDPETLEATAAVAGALDRLHGLGGRDSRTASLIWAHRDRLSVSLWARTLRDTDRSLDAIVVGNSVTRSGIDPELLSAETDLLVGNASVAGASAETMGLWSEQLLAALQPATIYIPVTYFDLYGNCRVESRIATREERDSLWNESFAGIVDSEGRSFWDIYLGPAGNPLPSSPIAATIGPEELAALGKFPVSRNPIPEQLAAAIENTNRAWQHDEICAERLPIISSLVAQYRADGHRVVMFVVEPNPALVAETSGTIEDFYSDATRYLDAAAPDQVLELDLTFDELLFEDGVHLLSSGREAVTRALARAIVADS